MRRMGRRSRERGGEVVDGEGEEEKDEEEEQEEKEEDAKVIERERRKKEGKTWSTDHDKMK